MGDRRITHRRRLLQAGKIEFNGAGTIDATVKNLSTTGAMLQVESVLGIPNEFTLFVEADKLKRQCQIIWRQPTKIGVRFVT
jgi:hypothetical protein